MAKIAVPEDKYVFFGSEFVWFGGENIKGVYRTRLSRLIHSIKGDFIGGGACTESPKKRSRTQDPQGGFVYLLGVITDPRYLPWVRRRPGGGHTP